MKILIADSIAEQGIDTLRSFPEFEIDFLPRITPEELLEKIGDYEALIVRSRTKVTEDVIARAARLKVIGRAGVGVDNVDVDSATRRGIIVLNAPEGNTMSTAEHTWAMILALARNVPQACASLKAGNWERNRFTGVELYGKILGIIGLGRIGTEVARRAHSMHMKVIAYDPFLSKERASQLGTELSEFDEVISSADFITVHCPLTQETKGIVGQKEFKKMKDGVRIINCARGGIVDEKALYDAIVSGKVAGAALDVFEQEPPTGNPLIALDNVIVTPHLGASTEEAQINVAVDVAEQVAHVLLGQPYKNAVNAPRISAETLAAVGPFLPLAESLGKLLAGLCGAGIRKVRLTYGGDLADVDTSMIMASFLRGLLSKVMTEEVNIINSRILALGRGIGISESKEVNSFDFASVVIAEVDSDKGTHRAAGTLFGKRDPRIVEIDGYRADAPCEGHVLIIPHVDKPGVVGPVGMVLGRYGVNIGSMHVARKTAGGTALMLLGVDVIPGYFDGKGTRLEEILADILKVDGVQDVKLVDLSHQVSQLI
ncbi:MAG TPA: phosphoglycerate dehydrogenase [Firmicutes bacterium]|nr:phosphoglycerate dehydrogenase [Bacillota bacterium]HHY98553.1 phosphoglycerate dehydrogenase [Bacillota bacterium]